MALDKLVDSTQLDSDLSSIADAIRAKSGGSNQLAFPAGFVSEIQAIPSGGGYTANDFLDPMKPEGAIQSDLASITVILDRRSKVTSVSLPNATAIPFNFCSNCSSLVSVSMPSITTFYQRNYAFQNCSALTTVYLPLATQIGTSQFENCTSLVRLVLQAATEFYNNALKGCINLEAVDFGPAKINLLRTSIFANDKKLSTVVLRRSDAIAPLAYLDAFNNTPFASGKSGGTLYVPAALISSYQAATNWSTILGYPNNQIKSIESTATDPNAPVDLTTHYIDGTPIPTT